MSDAPNWEERFKALVREINEVSLGIYPKAVIGGEKPYEKRTEHMEGWNAAAKELQTLISQAVKRASGDIDEDRALLVASDQFFMDDDGGLSINLNDTFGWACSESEDVPPECIKEVARLFSSWGAAGLIYWASKRRNWERSEFKDINRWIDFVRREEEWKVKEPSSSKRAYKDIEP